MVDQRGQLKRSGFVPVVAGVFRIAPPVELALLGQREGVTFACSNGDKPAPRLRQGFDSPGQHLGLQRAVAKCAIPAVPKRKYGAGVGHRQGEPQAERRPLRDPPKARRPTSESTETEFASQERSPDRLIQCNL